MQTKLTLSIDRDIIEQAKEFAKHHHKSLSKLVENYLRSAVTSQTNEITLTPRVSRIAGVLAGHDVEKHKSDYSEYLEKKYR